MDIGSSGWIKNVDQIAEQMEESLSLESTVVAQRASELREEAQKVCPIYDDVVRVTMYVPAVTVSSNLVVGTGTNIHTGTAVVHT